MSKAGGNLTDKYAQISVVAITALIAGGLWQLMPTKLGVDPTLLPPLTDVVKTMVSLTVERTLLDATVATFSQVFTAWAIAIPVGVWFGLLLATPNRLSKLLMPFFQIFLSIPKSVFLPFFILSLGLGFWQRTFFGVFQAVFYIALATSAARHSVPENLQVLGRSLGVSQLQLYRFIYIPAMVPYIFGACRVALTFIVTGVLFSEIYSSQRGLGYLIGNWSQTFELRKVYAALLLTSILCIAINESLRAAERRLSIWRAQ